MEIKVVRTAPDTTVVTTQKKKRGFFGLLVDFVLVLCTSGLWLLWLLIKHLRNG